MMFLKKKNQQSPSILNSVATEYSFNTRSVVVVVCLYAIFFTLIIRAFVIHVFPPSSKSLNEIAHRQYSKNLELSEYRGTIYDRRKTPLAISIKKPSFFINPRIFDPSLKELKLLETYLHIKVPKNSSKNLKYFSWLKRKTSVESAELVSKLNIKGLYRVTEPDRFYPYGENLASIIGSVGIDNKGLFGIENKLDKILRGNSLNINNSQDAKGRSIFFKSDFAAPEKAGNNVFLTIDQPIQEITQTELSEGVKRAQAKRGFAIVSDPHTGRILAIANYPTFNPNRGKLQNIESTFNLALSGSYEPGSVIKPIILASVIQRNAVQPNEMHYCENGIFHGDKWKIRDDHPIGTTDTAGVLIHSSNICIYKIAKRIGPDAIYLSLKEFGISTRNSLLDFPGQTVGFLSHPKKWSAVQFANISFGQGITTTGLEMISAYSAIVNGGYLMKPYLIDRIETSEGIVVQTQTSVTGKKVISPEVSNILRHMLFSVVEEGTGKSAKLDNYTVGGKTGTSEKVDPITKAYSPTKRIASFIGFSPINDPHLVVYVVIDEPGKTPYYGGLWAAPVFKAITEKTLKYLNVAPDKKNVNDITIAKGLLTKDQL